MRQKTIIDGFRNGQRFRYILRRPGVEGSEVGMYITIKQLANDFATTTARVAVWEALMRLSLDRYQARAHGGLAPTGLLTDSQGFQVQVDLVDE